MYPYIYLTPEKGLEFYLYLQKFNMDFSLSAVIFATANFHKRKFFLRHPVHAKDLFKYCDPFSVSYNLQVPINIGKGL